MSSTFTLFRRAVPAFLTVAFLFHTNDAMADPTVITRSVRDSDVYGEFHARRDARHDTAVIMLNGSDGGVPDATPARDLAQSGYPTLALAYQQDFAGNPTQVRASAPFPLESVLNAIEWLKRQRQVDPRRIVLMGVSRGAELALLVASKRPDIAGVIAFSPGSHVWGGVSSPRNYAFDVPMWSLGGQPIPYQVHVPDLKRPVRDWFAAAKDLPAARIPVERIGGPILLVSSKDDLVWPAARYADEIEAHLREVGFQFRIDNVQFADASHLLMGYGPGITQAELPGTNGYVARFGGSALGTERARDAGWLAAKSYLRSLVGDKRSGTSCGPRGPHLRLGSRFGNAAAAPSKRTAREQ